MPSQPRANLILGLLALIGGLLIGLVWVPLDTDTGLIETVRRQTTIGDALAPTIAAAVIGLGGLLLVVFERKSEDQSAPTLSNAGFCCALIAVLAVTFLVMRWAGPAAVSLLTDAESYRNLRDTPPWSLIGYFLGGVLMITGLIVWIEGRPSLRALIIAILATTVMIAIYDLPFDDLLLPPNGDV